MFETVRGGEDDSLVAWEAFVIGACGARGRAARRRRCALATRERPFRAAHVGEERGGRAVVPVFAAPQFEGEPSVPSNMAL
jgi:hypothetical protein